MAFDRDRGDDRRRERAKKTPDEELDRALEAAVEEESDGLSEDAGFETFLDRFPAAARVQVKPKPSGRR